MGGVECSYIVARKGKTRQRSPGFLPTSAKHGASKARLAKD